MCWKEQCTRFQTRAAVGPVLLLILSGALAKFATAQLPRYFCCLISIPLRSGRKWFPAQKRVSLLRVMRSVFTKLLICRGMSNFLVDPAMLSKVHYELQTLSETLGTESSKCSGIMSGCISPIPFSGAKELSKGPQPWCLKMALQLHCAEWSPPATQWWSAMYSAVSAGLDRRFI